MKQHLEDPDEVPFDPPCPFGQQLLGAMFGCVMAYVADLMLSSPLLTAFSLALGVTFGILGSAVSQPWLIKANEFLALSAVCFLISYILYLILGSVGLFGILLEALFISNLAAAVKTAFLALGVFHVDRQSLAACNV
jgi:hypothetical protein